MSELKVIEKLDEENLSIPNEVFAGIMEKVGIPKEELLDFLIKGMPNLSQEDKLTMRSEIGKWKESLTPEYKEQQKGILDTVRKAILETNGGSETYDRIANDLNVSRAKAKELYFRFQYFPTEEFMQKCKDSEQVGINY